MDQKEVEFAALERVLLDASAEPIQLSHNLLEDITKNFSEVIGSGGFGVVYMGNIKDMKVAVKKLFRTGDFSDVQFGDELQCLRRVKHKNIVRCLGYCSDTTEQLVEHKGKFVLAEERRRFLCFEYIPNQSLHDYLKDENRRREWEIHYELILGICQGLQYLHNEERINHLDLKPANILLDANMVPKITDFGLSRRFSGAQSRKITENIRGSLGYIAPEYWNRGEISFKSDIFSLGIIIRNILKGSPQLKRCIDVAQLCADDDQHKRPTINSVIEMLDVKEREVQTVSLVLHQSRNKSSSVQQVYEHKMLYPITNNLFVLDID
ncbi:hypothetical protein SETIT_8G071400v2 [Setaria italica]|uniref:non-specific serine/threonine protein kinase n=1 Tax=Setaria italica TaxID=4555 RepID=A0A368S511_SETIT|nr:hypothetical protein SETIT_8G071400v2 [Setaria italica]